MNATIAAMNTALLLLAGCASDARLEGHWQGVCAGYAPWAATVSLDLTEVGESSSAGPASVDRGYGAESGTARLVEDGEKLAVLLVEGDDEPWQMWQSLTYGWNGAGDDTWYGLCQLSPDGTFEVFGECESGWVMGFPVADCAEEDVAWSGGDEDMRSFMDTLESATDYGTEVRLSRDSGELSGAVAPEDTGATDDTGDSETTEPTTDPDDHVEFSSHGNASCTSATARASDRGGALSLACGEPGSYGSSARFTLKVPGVGTFNACDSGVSLKIDYGDKSETIGCDATDTLSVRINERIVDTDAGTALWDGHVKWENEVGITGKVISGCRCRWNESACCAG